jgi:cytochrome b561
MTRYHPALVALHWLLALLIVMALIAGNVLLEAIPNSDPAKIDGLKNHMGLGITIGVLMLIRFAFRLFTQKPPHADTGNRLLNIAGRVAHWGLYLLVFLMVASGLGIALSAGLPAIVGGSGDPLPADFSAYPPRAVHGIVSVLLMLLILAHVAGWAYHALFVKDRLLSRMWFGKRS